MHRVGTFLPSWAYMANEKYNKAYEAYQQAFYHDGCNLTFWFSISVFVFPDYCILCATFPMPPFQSQICPIFKELYLTHFLMSQVEILYIVSNI